MVVANEVNNVSAGGAPECDVSQISCGCSISGSFQSFE